MKMVYFRENDIPAYGFPKSIADLDKRKLPCQVETPLVEFGCSQPKPLLFIPCRGGGTGRRDGLKIR